MLRLIGKPFTIRTNKARADLRYAPRTKMSDGLAAMRRVESEPAGLASLGVDGAASLRPDDGIRPRAAPSLQVSPRT
jgi:hypothetical protein